ncbi:MAG TPA: 23S rRNA (guanosine(2251)-2'-O)-methyltransferase RlmB [Candidatus Limnocylindrales bacterium]|nr:23S rRNA (guanosine(2251)-2'-O)-methyltransferase RlmB [Candidatus Limnocylindrales bacterium]
MTRRPPDLIYGRNPVLEAFRANRGIRRLVLASGLGGDPRLQELRRLAADRGVPVEEADRQRLDDIAHSQAHQGVVAYVTRRHYWTLEALADAALADHPNAILLMLDSLQDPQNLGSISRTAEAAGVGGIVLSHNRSPEVTPAVVKASAGAAEHLRYARVANLAQALETLKAKGFWAVGLAGEAPAPYTDYDYRRPLVLLIGAEGEGLHQLLRKKADALVRLPMIGRVESLNAAVAGAILLYEVLRQRGEPASSPRP